MCYILKILRIYSQKVDIPKKFTSQSSNNNLYLAKVKLTLLKSSSSYDAAVLYNKLSLHISAQHF